MTTFAIDVGGTFTDIVVFDPESGEVRLEKTPTQPEAPSESVLRAIEKARVSLGEAGTFFHGTTLGINTVLEGKGATVGLITSSGCRDVLEIARMNWPMYRLHWDQPPPLVPRPLRKEVSERIAADGTVLQTFTDDEVRERVQELLDAGAESIAVCFLHAFAFPEHEARVGEIIAAHFPELDFTLSHQVSREYREYERTSTTVVDAMIKPRMVSYVGRLDADVGAQGFGGRFFVTRCDGGVMSALESRTQSIRTLTSGPASGVAGGATLAGWLGLDNVITIDMGGTSFDAALVVDRRPVLASVAKVQGVPLLMPVVEIAAIGAGGGSIAWIDPGGQLHVGPQSAGAYPGPICYGNGGTEPTFTDAALVSGLFDPDKFIGGEMQLAAESARKGIEGAIAEPLGLSVEDAASGIVTLTEAKMAATLEEITIGKGLDPREFTILAFGGNGALVASALAHRIGAPRVVVPRFPAVFSAWGMLGLDVVHDFAKTMVTKMGKLSSSEIAAIYEGLEADAVEALERESIPPEDRSFHRSLDMRYELQEHTLQIPLGEEDAAGISFESLRKRFDEAHKVAYGYDMPHEAVDVVTYRVRAVGRLPKPEPLKMRRGDGDASRAVIGTRVATHGESGGAMEWTVYDRAELLAGDRLDGPALIEEETSMTLVAPWQQAEVDDLGNIVMTAREGA
ncbi:MAG TPA: hydantoinase/oxoprolinase family protein [Actinomycetota bacterium]|nr:hydantoinase/oxoprolinase family protein [Actinomycetota bacterium]